MFLTDKQKEYINHANKRWNIKVGATGTGKTWIDYNHTILKRTLELKGKEGLYLLVGVSYATVERNVLEPMRELYGKQLVSEINKSSGTVKLFDETYHVIGAEKANAINRIRGATVKYVYGDEFIDWHEEFFKMLTTRLRTNHSIADLTGNPKAPNHWAKKFIDDNKDNIFYQNSTIFDNPTLPKEFIEAQELELEKGSARYTRYFLGQWAQEEGQIYKSFNRRTHVIPIEKFNERKYNKAKGIHEYVHPLRSAIKIVHIGVDFGGNKSKTTFQCTAIVPQANGMIKDIGTIHERRFEKERDSVYLGSQFVKFIKEVIDLGYPIREIRADSAEQVLIRTLQTALTEAGLGYTVKNSIKGRINDRIDVYRSLQATNRYFVLSNCINTIEAFENAVWSDKPNSKGEDVRLDDGTTNIDTLDAQEYSTESLHARLLPKFNKRN